MSRVLKILSLFLVVFFMSGTTHAQQFNNLTGGDVPFPWGTEIPFPWDSIDGVWVAQDGLNEFYYNIKVVDANETGSHHVQMSQFNPVSMDLMASGGGFFSSHDRVLRVIMNMKDSEANYLSIVRAYEYERHGVTDVATVITIKFFGDNANEDLHFILKKVSDIPLAFPEEQ